MKKMLLVGSLFFALNTVNAEMNQRQLEKIVAISKKELKAKKEQAIGHFILSATSFVMSQYFVPTKLVEVNTVRNGQITLNALFPDTQSVPSFCAMIVLFLYGLRNQYKLFHALNEYKAHQATARTFSALLEENKAK
ncbi:MAG: hypothetical protein EBZ47_09350 [Chlamydiae bacterium]|nr:hypothetical protein [Chlamydiota bacterium]